MKQDSRNDVLYFLFHFPEVIIRERSQSVRNHVCSQAVPDGSIHSHVSPVAASCLLPPMTFPTSTKLPWCHVTVHVSLDKVPWFDEQERDVFLLLY